MVEFASRTGCEGMPYLMETFLLQDRCYNYYLLLILPIKISLTILLYYIATHIPLLQLLQGPLQVC